MQGYIYFTRHNDKLLVRLVVRNKLPSFDNITNLWFDRPL
jgi:hypothetical protein